MKAVGACHELTVLTSCAVDATTWAMHYAPGSSIEGGVQVRRFAHGLRNEGGRARVPLAHKWRWWLRAGFDLAGRTRVALPSDSDELDGHLFLRRQGPACDGLVDELRRSDHDVVVFFTALYFTTAEGLPACRAPALLIPTLHDEKPMVLPWFHRVFAAARQTLYNTAAERRLARRLYGTHAADGEVVGAGVAVRRPTPAQIGAARTRHALPERYLVYVGRIEKGKGCADLLAAWHAIAAHSGDAALVFVGKGSLPIEASARVRPVGFVTEAERDALVAGAAALVMPSRFESLSLVTLEAFALGVPVLANGAVEVLAEQLRDSGAGEAYRGARGLRRGLLRALARSAAERRALGEAGRRYVDTRYRWDIVVGRWLDAVERASRADAGAR